MTNAQKLAISSQHVMVHNFHPNELKWIPGTVIKKTGPLSYVVNIVIGLNWKRHVDHIREVLAEALPELDPQENTEERYVDTTPFHDNNNSNTIATKESITPTSEESRQLPTRQHNPSDTYENS